MIYEGSVKIKKPIETEACLWKPQPKSWPKKSNL
jgi:hypothetical protein